MSVTINTNTAATIASNNLSASNAMLQRSLNRLSSGSKIVNASDDAGGVAVASRLSAAAKRSGAANANIGNAVSFLQNQDTALKTMGKMLERMSELKTLYTDTTKSSTDLANYTLEFDKLGDQLDALAQTKYNGNSLLASSSNLVVKTDDAGSTYTLSTPTDNMAVSGYGNYSIGSGGGTSSVAGGFYSKTGTTVPAAAGTNDGNLVINGAVIVVATGDTVDMIAAKINANSATKASASVVDGHLKLTGTTQGSGTSGTASDTTSGLSVLDSTPETLAHLGLAADNAVAGGADDVTNAIQAVAKQRSANGSDQSVLGYYSELASATKTNFESAVSKIMDVDVAEESTQLARWNTLVQAGTAMIAQANGSTQSALSLLR
jgi:flagellin-like hook-associated protein FlgL